jgi:hypothetical protein
VHLRHRLIDGAAEREALRLPEGGGEVALCPVIESLVAKEDHLVGQQRIADRGDVLGRRAGQIDPRDFCPDRGREWSDQQSGVLL